MPGEQALTMKKKQLMCQRNGVSKSLSLAVNHFNSARYSPIRGGRLRENTQQKRSRSAFLWKRTASPGGTMVAQS
jgi:hypothetical protein